MALRTIAQLLDERLIDPNGEHNGEGFTIKAAWNGEHDEVEYDLFEVLADGMVIAPSAEKADGGRWKPFMAPFTSFDVIRIVEGGDE